MKKDLIIDMSEIETRAALLEDGRVVEFFFERATESRLAGNIFKGIVENVLPGIQSAFINTGFEKNAFLFIGDVLFDEKSKPKRIEELFKTSQEVIVQVAKEPMGTKGARITTKITLPGRYVVIMPGMDTVGVSHRISSADERDRLKRLVERVRSPDTGIIVRTVAEGKKMEDLREDIENLGRLWKRIQKKAEIISSPAILYEEASILYTLVRDVVDDDLANLWINSYFGYQKLKDFVESIIPRLSNRIRLFDSRENIFDHFGLNREIEKALSRKVWLKSGGYLVFDRTEAMTVIDVNTGKFVGKKNLQETILKTNLEAAQEIARQVRLRDLGGIILIDFIDMGRKEHQKEVVRKLELALSCDRTRCTVVEMSELGLVEMTRKRVRKNLDSILRESCQCCDGDGKMPSLETVAIHFLRKLEEICRHSTSTTIAFLVGEDLGMYLDQHGKKFIDNLMRVYTKEIVWNTDSAVSPRRYTITGVGEEAIRESLFSEAPPA
ncbi:MAG TPA: Rne/Rng family ribonuclease [Atribacteraceae bacterium]|nr:Rne/Rng family ribonuclease [Atribacteraceae bacterium]